MVSHIVLTLGRLRQEDYKFEASQPVKSYNTTSMYLHCETLTKMANTDIEIEFVDKAKGSNGYRSV